MELVEYEELATLVTLFLYVFKNGFEVVVVVIGFNLPDFYVVGVKMTFNNRIF